MNPFKVNKIIKESKENGERITIDALSQRCGIRIRHKYVHMSDEMFECDECGGFPRHWVERLNLFSWIALFFYKPKNNDFQKPNDAPKKELEIAQDMNEALNNNTNQE